MGRIPTGEPNGRPGAPIDWKRVDELLEANCHGTEVAAYFGIHPSTFYKRVEEQYGMGFTQFSSEKKQKGDSLLREKQYTKAIKGDNTLLIWLGKNRLNQKDHDDKIVVTTEAMEKLEKSMSLVTYLQSKLDPESKPSSEPDLKIEDNSISAEQKS